MAQQAPNDVLRRYLQDAIAAERNFEKQLRDMADDSRRDDVRACFAEHADETRRQHERLTERIQALGGSPSQMKAFMSTLFGFAPRTAQLGHEKAERTTQDLIMAYAIENSEVAMYEALAEAASAAGDPETERLARDIQREEQRTAERVWNLIPDCAREAFQQVTGIGAEPRARRAA